ncbi:MAG: F0F1 ATP synthase subunit alpha [Caldisericia bacterium]|nr:F0F1 ATP synthase subunit alpha [Caldisericia bacterium]MDD4615092.1 F0F1 ATP synthase subunit alpha [Caldisericia bacterium]
MESQNSTFFQTIQSDIEKALRSYQFKGFIFEQGVIQKISASVLIAKGISNSFCGEMIQINRDSLAFVFGFIANDLVQLILLKEGSPVHTGDPIYRTGKPLQISVGRSLLGRVVSPIGSPLDGKGEVTTNHTRNIESAAPSVMKRKPVQEPLHTGIKVIDSMIPIGKGQRELIVGDRQTGKSALLMDTILTQAKTDTICIFVAISQRSSTVASIIRTLTNKKAIQNTIFIVSLAEDPASLRYIAPFAGAAVAEYFASMGKDVLVVYDDLSKHAEAYREISLLLRRPPSREAYPSDIFYLHSRLLERAGSFHKSIGGGTITALPVVETLGGDISQYIPTNLISITDGQIYLEKNMFNAGIRPAINVGLSVSRVGSAAQTKAMKKVSSGLRLELSQYNDLKAFTEFGTELDNETKARLTKGEQLVEIMKQKDLEPLNIEKQVILLFAYKYNFTKNIPPKRIAVYQDNLYRYMKTRYPRFVSLLETKKEISPNLEKALSRVIQRFTQSFMKTENESL